MVSIMSLKDYEKTESARCRKCLAHIKYNPENNHNENIKCVHCNEVSEPVIENRCIDCTYFKILPDVGIRMQPMGLCRRYPPVLREDGTFRYPLISALNVICGEFENEEN